MSEEYLMLDDMDEAEMAELAGTDENRFIVNDDAKADWCIRKIKEARQEKEKWVSFYKERMEKAVAECDNKETFFINLLMPYFDTVPHKETKTQQSYTLPGGKLVMKKQNPQYTTDDETLVPWLKSCGMGDLVKVKEAADWAALKKEVTLTPDGMRVMDENGEIIPGVIVTQRPDVFKVEMEG